MDHSDSRALTSPNHVRLNMNIGIDGSPSSFHHFSDYRSILYLTPDTEADKGVSGGFDEVKGLLPSSQHVVFNPVFHQQTDPTVISSTDYKLEALRLYKQYEEALDSLPKPVLILCKSNRRASAVYAAYDAVKRGLTSEEAISKSSDPSSTLAYTKSPAIVSWVTTVVDSLLPSLSSLLVFRQLFESVSSTYTYILADSATREAVIIDPVLEKVERDAQVIRELQLELKYAVNTHVHADHITGSGALKRLFPGSQSVISSTSGAVADVKLSDGDVITFGSRKLFCRATPGHTNGCISYILDDLSKVFTGDTMLIRGCGRTDFQEGSSERLYSSVHSVYWTLPDSCAVYPGHDYKGLTSSTIGEEKAFNPRLGRRRSKAEDGSETEAFASLEEFSAIMAGLNLAHPKMMDVAVPANLQCGV